MRITLPFRTDLNVKNLHVVLGENWILDYWVVDKNLLIQCKFIKWTITVNKFSLHHSTLFIIIVKTKHYNHKIPMRNFLQSDFCQYSWFMLEQCQNDQNTVIVTLVALIKNSVLKYLMCFDSTNVETMGTNSILDYSDKNCPVLTEIDVVVSGI